MDGKGLWPSRPANYFAALTQKRPCVRSTCQRGSVFRQIAQFFTSKLVPGMACFKEMAAKGEKHTVKARLDSSKDKMEDRLRRNRSLPEAKGRIVENISSSGKMAQNPDENS